jgi:hypothetical protein
VAWRRYPLEPFVLALVALAAFSPLYVPDWQDGSRLALTQALALDGTVRTDRYQTRFSGDVAFFDGHYYSDKAPGMSFVALPGFEALRAAGQIGPQERRYGIFGQASLPLWFLRLTTSGLALLLAVFLVGRAAEGLVPRTGAATAATLGVGTLALPLTPIMFGHLSGAAPALAAFLLARAARDRAFRLAAAGFCAGLAVLFEYQTALIGLVVAAYVLARTRSIRGLGAFAAGAVPPALALGAYDRLAFGSPFHLSYRYVASQYTESLQRGFFGIGVPRLRGLYEVLLTRQGLLVASPVLILAGAGLVLLWRRGLRAEALACGAVSVLFLVYDAGYFQPYGGFSPGPRYFAPALPFLALGLPDAFRRWPWVTSLAALASVGVMLWVTGTWDRSPDFSTVWTRLGAPHDVGMLLMLAGAVGALAVGLVGLRADGMRTALSRAAPRAPGRRASPG